MPATAYRLAKLRIDPAPDFGLVVARLKRLTGLQLSFLAVTLKLSPRRLGAISSGARPTWTEGQTLLAALRAAGGTVDGLLTRSPR